jgi:hypothetical protein
MPCRQGVDGDAIRDPACYDVLHDMVQNALYEAHQYYGESCAVQ